MEQGGHDIPNPVDEWVMYEALSSQEIIAYQNNPNPLTMLQPEKYTALETLHDQY